MRPLSALCVVVISCMMLFTHSVIAAPISLMQAIDLTLQYNDDLASKQASFDADKELIDQAKANVRPAIDLRHTIGNSRYSTAYFQDLDDRYTRTTLALVQPLYSAQRLINLERSEEIVQVSELEFESHKQSKLLELIEAYITLLKYQKATVIAQQEVDDHLIKMQRLESMLSKGLTTKMDTLEARSVLDELNSNLIATKNDALVSKTRLSRLLGRPVENIVQIDEYLWQRSNAILMNTQWHSLVMENALAIELSRKEYDVAQSDLRIESAAHLPEVNFRMELVRNEAYDSSIIKDKKIQLEIMVPIYHGGMIASKSRAAQSQLKSKLHKINDSERLVKVQLDEMLTKLEGGVAKIEAYEKSMLSNQAYLEAAQKGMAYGLRGLFDVLEAKSRLYTAQRKLTFEMYDNIFSQFEFLYLLGMLDRSTVSHYLNPSFSFNSLSVAPTN
ncbi:MAG: TolC family protein [Pseudomonadota bacterium]|nr:TolC family protein [Pseudomonadota bacterium]